MYVLWKGKHCFHCHIILYCVYMNTTQHHINIIVLTNKACHFTLNYFLWFYLFV